MNSTMPNPCQRPDVAAPKRDGMSPRPRGPAGAVHRRIADVVMIAGLVLALSGTAAGASPIYRCGSTYTSAPCPQAVALDNVDARSTAQQAEARATIEQQKRLGAEMERDRRREEAAHRPALAGSFGPSRPAVVAAAPRPTPKKHSRKHATAGVGADTPFTATNPSVRKRRSPAP